MDGRAVHTRIFDITHFSRHLARSCHRRIRLALPVTAFGLVLSGCASIWNASDLVVWVQDQAVDQGCQRETIELDDWYTETAEGNVWRGTCKDPAGTSMSFGINVDSVWKPSK